VCSSDLSAIFNRVLADRLRDGTLAKLTPGDLAYKHDSGGCFVVDDEAMASIDERLARFDVSPAGPLIGEKLLAPTEGSSASEHERQAIESMGLTAKLFAEGCARFRLTLPGARRPMRIPIGDPEIEGGADEHGPFIRLAFDLPPGAYATAVIREISKNTHPVVPAS